LIFLLLPLRLRHTFWDSWSKGYWKKWSGW